MIADAELADVRQRYVFRVVPSKHCSSAIWQAAQQMTIVSNFCCRQLGDRSQGSVISHSMKRSQTDKAAVDGQEISEHQVGVLKAIPDANLGLLQVFPLAQHICTHDLCKIAG